VWFGGIAAAVIKRLPKRAHDAEREQARRLLRAYARWHLNRGEGDKTEAWERDRKLLGTHAHKTRPETPPEQVRSSRHTQKTKRR
jgi:hypothetical protein